MWSCKVLDFENYPWKVVKNDSAGELHFTTSFLSENQGRKQLGDDPHKKNLLEKRFVVNFLTFLTKMWERDHVPVHTLPL